MVIDAFIRNLFRGTAFGVAFIAAFGLGRVVAEDQIRLKNGSSVTGQIVSYSNGQILISSRTPNGTLGKTVVYASDVQSIAMATPAAAQIDPKSEPPAVIAALAPLVKAYAGVPADWVVDAMARLGEAYDRSGQSAQAATLYDQINQLYPGSPYQLQATAGQAHLKLNAGQVDQALALVQPIVTRANADLAPSPGDARVYANVFLVYGQILEAQKKLPDALEAYLTVKTMLYQNPELASQADDRAQQLLRQNPNVGVN